MTTTHKREAVNVEDLDATLRARAAFRPSELAEHWQCSERHIYNLIRRGALRAFKVGGNLRISAEEVSRIEGGSPPEPVGNGRLEFTNPWGRA